jgi:hypothetical protein
MTAFMVYAAARASDFADIATISVPAVAGSERADASAVITTVDNETKIAAARTYDGEHTVLSYKHKIYWKYPK